MTKENDLRKIEEIEQESFEEDDYNEIPPSDIVSYNELRSCADIYRMYKQNILDISPDFQREFVWGPSEQTRFIDSLIKQLPIPSMCFAYDYNKQKWIVIDGLQRISTIIRFLDDDDWTLSNLNDIDKNLAGTKISKIKDSNGKLYNYYTKIENITLPITVIRCDFEKATHNEFLFTIFHRLNTGGVKLTNQEIRNCIYNGKFNTLLKRINKENDIWRQFITGTKYEKRMKSIEIILRFFAFFDEYEKYSGYLSKFLNRYMSKNKNPNENWLSTKEELFNRTMELLNKFIDKKEFKSKPLAILESVMVGLARNIEKYNSNIDIETVLKNKYEKLLKDENFSEQSLKEGLSKPIKLKKRMEIAENIFNLD